MRPESEAPMIRNGLLSMAAGLLVLLHAAAAGAAAPVITVTKWETYDRTPALSGTVNNQSATVSVTIGQNSYAAVNKGNGTWALDDGSIDTLLLPGTYDVIARATNSQNETGTDTTTNELTILGSYGVQGAFNNILVVPPGDNPPASQSTAAVFFSGDGPRTVNIPDPENPGDPPRVRQLRLAAFGQATGSSLPVEGYIDNTLENGHKDLYWSSVNTEEENKATAFRYLHEQYNPDTASQIVRNKDGVTQYWSMANKLGQDAQKKALEIRQSIEGTLRYQPTNAKLRAALLDIIYDTAAANLAIAHEKKAKVVEYRIGVQEPPQGGFIIDLEIAALEQCMTLYENALKGYMELLRDPLGVDVSELTSDTTRHDEPFGYFLFREEVPRRSPFSQLYQNGVLFSLTPTFPKQEQYQLFEGYKDLALIFEAERDLARTMQELATLYIQRGNPALAGQPSDVNKARQLLNVGLAARYIELNVLLNIFRDQTGFTISGGWLPPESGAAEALGSLRSALTALDGVKGFLTGSTNLLGFDDDFLVLAQPQTANFKSTFDYFENYLKSDPASPLVVANQDFIDAKTDYVNYRDRLDTLEGQFDEKNEQYDARLLEIEGVNPATPEDNSGSALWQTRKNIELAQLRIRKNKAERENLEKEISYQVNLRAQSAANYADMQSITYAYGNKQAKLTEKISQIKAAMAFAEKTANWAENTLTLGGNFAMAGVMAAGEIRIGQLTARKEQLAADETAHLTAIQGKQLDQELAVRIQSLMLQFQVIALDSLEAAILLEKEAGQRDALYVERDDLRRRKAEVNLNLAHRYFADPVHRLTSLRSLIRADASFREAREWVFLALRALEYKRNQRFVPTMLPSEVGGRAYSRSSIFKLRNAKELNDFMTAMSIVDEEDQLGDFEEDAIAKVSMKKDIAGYRRPAVGMPQNIYIDPGNPTGGLVNDETAWKSFVQARLKTWEPSDSPDGQCKFPGRKVIKLEFSTAFTPIDSLFFTGNSFSDKIDYMRIVIDSSEPIGNANKPACLSNGGVARVRNQRLGYQNSEEPDRIINETTDYSTRHYVRESGKWVQMENLNAFVPVLAGTVMQEDPSPPAQDSAYNIDVFRERSIAATKWTLIVPYEQSGLQTIKTDKIDDIYVWFYWKWWGPRLPAQPPP